MQYTHLSGSCTGLPSSRPIVAGTAAGAGFASAFGAAGAAGAPTVTGSSPGIRMAFFGQASAQVPQPTHSSSLSVQVLAARSTSSAPAGHFLAQIVQYTHLLGTWTGLPSSRGLMTVPAAGAAGFASAFGAAGAAGFGFFTGGFFRKVPDTIRSSSFVAIMW